MKGGDKVATNETMKAGDLLRSAAKLIDRAKAQLDVGEKPCRTCRCRVFDNPTHARVNERIAQMPTKLAEMAEWLKDGG